MKFDAVACFVKALTAIESVSDLPRARFGEREGAGDAADVDQEARAVEREALGHLHASGEADLVAVCPRERQVNEQSCVEQLQRVERRCAAQWRVGGVGGRGAGGDLQARR